MAEVLERSRGPTIKRSSDSKIRRRKDEHDGDDDDGSWW